MLAVNARQRDDHDAYAIRDRANTVGEAGLPLTRRTLAVEGDCHGSGGLNGITEWNREGPDLHGISWSCNGQRGRRR